MHSLLLRSLTLSLCGSFSSTLSSQSLLHAALFLARLQIKGVTLHVLNDVFGLNFALKSTKSVL